MIFYTPPPIEMKLVNYTEVRDCNYPSVRTEVRDKETGVVGYIVTKDIRCEEKK